MNSNDVADRLAKMKKSLAKKPKKQGKIITDPNADTKIEKPVNILDGIDDLSAAERKELERASKIDSISKQTAVPRERKQFKKVEVTCRICHRKEEVAPSLVPRSSKEKGEEWNPYVCNRCSSGGG